MTVHLHLPFPLSVNALYKNVGKRRAKSKRYIDWLRPATYALKAQYRGKLIEGPIMVTLAYKQPDRRRRDVGNLEKCVTDLMTGVVYKDDSQIKILCAHFDETDSPIGTRVIIEPISSKIAVNFLKSYENRYATEAVSAPPVTSETASVKETRNGN